MDGARRELADAGILIEDGVIRAVGAVAEPATEEVIDAAGCVVTPGLVNTHHHLFQTLTRAVPAGQDALLFGWLRALYPIWARMQPEDIFVSAQLGLAELALSGCTMSSDHLYLFPNGSRLDDTIEAAATVGHPLPPDPRGDERRRERRRAAAGQPGRGGARDPGGHGAGGGRLHDPSPGAMVRVGLAPCSPFSVSTGLMRDAAALSRDKEVMLHTHLAENDEDIAYSLSQFGCRPGQYAEDLGWTGEHVWHAHCVKLDPARSTSSPGPRTGVAHCPCSNSRLGSGIAPVRQMRDAGVQGGRSASTGRPATTPATCCRRRGRRCCCSGCRNGADAMGAREALEIATLRRGAGAGARGASSAASRPGKRADLAIWDVGGLAAAGAWDPVAALVLCGPFKVRDLLVGGPRPVVPEGRLAGAESRPCVERAARRGGAAGARAALLLRAPGDALPGSGRDYQCGR